MWNERDRCGRGHDGLRKVDRVRVHRREQVQAPQDQAGVHMTTLREGRIVPEVVTGTLSTVGYRVPTLLVPGTTNSVISYRLAALAPIPTSPLPEMWRV